MARQNRAVQTRQTILLAAAAVFDEHGYGAATIQEILTRAGVTKGALYFHFASKEELALSIMAAQLDSDPLPSQPTRMQELVDLGLVFARRLQREPLVRASVQLAMDPWSEGLDRSGPFQAWIGLIEDLLNTAKDRGELLSHVDPRQTAEMLAGAFSGIQELSHVLTDREDLTHRIVVLLRHVLPSITLPAVLVTLDVSEGRLERLTGG
ncbi:ScbR family autoregulator-binding transcription factor [Amorphoplanes digitatis]|uniref:AcrR family transcriptional regulator n=1 Tax=Actinoplanes digitatis TaxID=1868 RepID=A0A7W7I134_9ACTN|nr:ScbR family autoregulator-binding transcription factor [Actinoplanes digitatis]MBB4764454.1 AcrR family transcriptional regulator [Actinoplanes digitatis]GID94059.1 gamma-butyrolactone-binding protein [Actinoplanes digitatis]